MPMCRPQSPRASVPKAPTMRTASRAAKGPYPPLQKEMPASFRTRQSCASFVATAEDAMDEPITAHTFLSRYHGEACAMLVKRSKHAKTFRRIVPRSDSDWFHMYF